MKKKRRKGAAGPVFRIDEIILSGQGEEFDWLHKNHLRERQRPHPMEKRISHQRRKHPEHPPSGAGAGTNEMRQLPGCIHETPPCR